MTMCGLHVRDNGEGQEQSRVVVGTPIVFGVRSVNLTPWSDYREVYEVMEPGSISDELLRSSDVILNLNHSNKVTDVLGRCRNGEGTLKLTRNVKDIGSECELPKTNAANDTLELIRRGDITGMSFAFEDDWEDSENGVSYERMKNEDHDGKEVWVRHVKRVTALYDVSIVTHPAYEQTSVGTREQGDEIMKRIDAQIAAQEPQETDEQRQQREAEEAESARKAAEQEAEKQREAEAEAARQEAERIATMERERRERQLTRMRQQIIY